MLLKTFLQQLVKNSYFSAAMKNKNHLTEVQRYRIAALSSISHRKHPVTGKQINIKNKVSIDQCPNLI